LLVSSIVGLIMFFFFASHSIFTIPFIALLCRCCLMLGYGCHIHQWRR
jgi:hypothetical protein